METETAMRVSASSSGDLGSDRRQAEEFQRRETPVAALPAVVPVRDRMNQETPGHSRPSAALLAQLVASVENLPVARARRRADPRTGTEAYRVIANIDMPPRNRASRTF
jgi:hypothetical protein